MCDTGGQYGDGTTDITRTNHFGKPTDDERRCYTRVLQGHVGMARAIFPEGTPGVMFDALARAPLWRDGLNYLHGTGHGMGSYLNVHEGPFGVGGGAVTADKQFASHAAKLRYLNEIRRGHYVSDEPGFYKMAHSGSASSRTWSRWWRRRSTRTVRERGSSSSTSRPCPFLGSLTDPSLLLEDEVAWIDDFHSQCWATVAPLLTHQNLDDAQDAARARQWLWRETRPLQEEACPPVPPMIDPSKCHSILDS